MTDVRSKRGADDENAGSTKAKPDKSDKSGTPDPAKSDTAKPDTAKSDAAKPDTEQPTSSEFDLPPKTEESEAAESDTGRRDEDEDDEDTEELRRRYLLRRFWQTAIRLLDHARASDRLAALSAALLVIILLNLAASYGMNLWNRGIFDALEKRDAAAVLHLSLIYFAILAVSVSFSVMQVYARMTIQRRWRKWLTDNLVDPLAEAGRYYQLNLVSGDHQNPEYRIADDVRIATESPVDFVSGVTQAFLSAATFIVVLWTIGGALEFQPRRHRTSTSPASW